MIDTPMGETSTVEDLHRYTTCGPDPSRVLTGAEWFDTSKFPVFVRVITRPAIIRTSGHADTGDAAIEVVAEAETTTYVLESEDIEIADNAVWFIVGAAPEPE